MRLYELKMLKQICDFPLDANGGSDMEMTMMNQKGRASKQDESPLNVPSAPSLKCLCKCATFPVTDGNSSSAESKDKAHGSQSQENGSYLRSLSLPVPRKLVSAMKGSREKEGLPLKKLSVSWAPDVYDPPPSSVSHLPKKKSNQQYKNNRKHGKGSRRARTHEAVVRKTTSIIEREVRGLNHHWNLNSDRIQFQFQVLRSSRAITSRPWNFWILIIVLTALIPTVGGAT